MTIEPKEKPYIICHMLTSLDGKIDGEFFSAPECLPALQQFSKVRNYYNCSATLYGTTTMEGSYADGRIGELPKSYPVCPHEDYIAGSDVQNYIVSLDPNGILGLSGKYVEKKNRPKAHIIEVLTEQVSNKYIAYLRNLEISYIFAEENQFDCNLLLGKLKNLFGISKLMISGGGLTTGRLYREV